MNSIESNPEANKEQEVDWENIKQQYLEIIKKYSIDSGKNLTEEQIEQQADHINNFNQYFVKNEDGEVSIDARQGIVGGHVKLFSEEENEQRTMKEYLEEFNQKAKTTRDLTEPAASPKDFYYKHSENYLKSTVNQFLRDIHEALQVAGLGEDDLKKENYAKDKQDLAVKAFQYLVATKGYNWKDLAS